VRNLGKEHQISPTKRTFFLTLMYGKLDNVIKCHHVNMAGFRQYAFLPRLCEGFAWFQNSSRYELRSHGQKKREGKLSIYLIPLTLQDFCVL